MSNILNLKGVKFFAIVVLAVAILATFGIVAVQQASADCTVTPTVRVGSTGASVQCVQTKVGVTADGSFGPITKAAVMAYQSANGLTADGVVGPMTAASLNGSVSGSYPAGCTSNVGFSTTTGMSCVVSGSNLPAGCTSTAGYSSTTGVKCDSTVGSNLPAGCTSTAGYSSTTGVKCDGTSTGTGPLVGGAGSVDSYQLVASLSNEEVGEGTNDVKVYGLEIEAGDGSDLSLTAAKLVFDEGTAASNFRDYADEVSVWLGSKKVGTVDSDKFTDDNSWTQTVSLSDAVIKAGVTANLYVAVSAVSNLDSSDATDTWTLNVTSVRWNDATGSLISEDPGTATRTFSFETTSVAADTEFKILTDDLDVNDAHVIDVADTETTSNLPILSFKVKIEGTQDIELKDLPVNYDVVTQDNIDEMVEGLALFMDGTQVSTVNMTADCVEDGGTCTTVGGDETYIFHDIDTWLKAGQTYHFLVKADIYGLTDTGDVAAGDTIAANVGETQTDLTGFDAEDETGTNLVDADKTGTVTGSASEVRDVGVKVALVGTPTAVKIAGEVGGTPPGDSGTFTVNFDVTAFGADMYIDATAPDATGGTTESDVDVTGAGTLTCTMTSPSGATLSTSYLVRETETERFAVTCDIRDGATDLVDGFFDVLLTNLAYAITDAQTVNIDYTFDLSDFKTPQIFLNDNE